MRLQWCGAGAADGAGAGDGAGVGDGEAERLED